LLARSADGPNWTVQCFVELNERIQGSEDVPARIKDRYRAWLSYCRPLPGSTDVQPRRSSTKELFTSEYQGIPIEDKETIRRLVDTIRKVIEKLKNKQSNNGSGASGD
jgi:hypothetical protein